MRAFARGPALGFDKKVGCYRWEHWQRFNHLIALLTILVTCLSMCFMFYGLVTNCGVSVLNGSITGSGAVLLGAGWLHSDLKWQKEYRGVSGIKDDDMFPSPWNKKKEQSAPNIMMRLILVLIICAFAVGAVVTTWQISIGDARSGHALVGGVILLVSSLTSALWIVKLKHIADEPTNIRLIKEHIPIKDDDDKRDRAIPVHAQSIAASSERKSIHNVIFLDPQTPSTPGQKESKFTGSGMTLELPGDEAGKNNDITTNPSGFHIVWGDSSSGDSEGKEVRRRILQKLEQQS